MKKDILGKALLDYFRGEYSEDIRTETTISEPDVLPLPYLFRNYSAMPALEQKALQLAKGRVLDVGCGAGSHSLYLQEKGLDVVAVDSSPGAVEVAKLRGVRHTKHIDILDLNNETFDTILLLMNGTGIFQNLEQTPKYLQHLKKLLRPGGQILLDSSDLIYMFEEDTDGGVWIPAEMDYYGALQFTMTYKGETTPPFPWLYLDIERLQQLAQAEGLYCQLVAEGDSFDYLARITTAL